ncbi:hypothetical protein CAPTEDRAFT_176487 [Capitella teleta]|uniref:IGFBP N-terminal domain-containing protein n=1 Tax=Capitella teleta TaxID=283909 RepID=R7UUA7_CAPTE|nr:hypothetical protein CAPTEDRAFT_176487 [Capitella teleta]|eukprot:ELU06981.1 hypothetical protein CAPTEDRAFT_176487 [Capitella teleta]
MKGALTILVHSAFCLAVVIVHAQRNDGASSSLELQCPPCSEIHCMPKKAKRLKCNGGVTKGICNCCPVCAKVEGEACGGQYEYLGKCDRGLECLPVSDNSIGSKSQVDFVKKKVSKWALEGKCVKSLKMPSESELMDQPMPDPCKPKCTPDYCREDPKAICSALDNADLKQDCQGDCQHTSCSACRFVHEPPECQKCDQDDFRCMRSFGTCIKRDFCSRQKFPCRKDVQTPDSKFKCLVAKCK